MTASAECVCGHQDCPYRAAHARERGQQTRHELAATVPSYDRSAHRSTVPRMTRRHFRVIAEALAAARPFGHESLSSGIWWEACTRMAEALARTNPQFDRERFLMWCEE